jgi:hypothetical protein
LTAKNPVPVPRPPAPPDNTLVLTDKLDFNHDKANDIIDLIDEVDEEAPANYLSDQTRVSELTARELAQLIEAAVARALIKAGKN